MSQPIVRPILRWAGSKRKLLPKLVPYWGAGFDRYIEPFAGSAALFYAIAPRQAILADINSDLVQALGAIQKAPKKVYGYLADLPIDASVYYQLRAVGAESLPPTQRAARFMYLNRFCYNGLYRTNRAGQFNVPFAPVGSGALPSLSDFLASAEQLRRAELLNADFEVVIRDNVKQGDFVYLDPPYAVGNRRVFRQYDPQSFGLEDLERLSALLDEIDRRGAHFLLSYAYCKEALTRFKGWGRRKVFTQRNISGFVQHRRMAAELLVSNIEPSDRRSTADEKRAH